ncbi:MAG: hypothetical protein WCF84_23130 [Anaerolineae bacterium]
MEILIFLGIPVLVCVILMLLSLPQVLETEEDLRRLQQLDSEEPPHFARDYSGRVWVDRRHKGFFRQLRRRSKTPSDDSTD